MSSDNSVDLKKKYKIEEAVSIVKKLSTAKFNESIDIAVNLGVDMSKSDQRIRGVITVPHNIGKVKKVLVICDDRDAAKCLKCGADFAGGDSYIEKIFKGWTDFDVLVTVPKMMIKLSKVAKILGPKGLMPNTKTGGIVKSIDDVFGVIKEIKEGGRIEVKADGGGVVHNSIGKKSFDDNILIDNIKAYLQTLFKMKPLTSKGTFIKNITLSSTMGSGVKIDSNYM